MAAVPLRETFKRELFSKEVEGWLGRASDQDKERFERVFESITSLSDSQKVPDAHADFINSTLSKIKTRTSSAGRPPLAPGGSPVAVGGKGWVYTGTRSAISRPETQAHMATLQAKLAAEQQAELETRMREQQAEEGGRPLPGTTRPLAKAAAAAAAAHTDHGSSSSAGERPHSAPGSRDPELQSFEKAAARRRAISFAHTSGSSAPASPSGDHAAAAGRPPRPQSGRSAASSASGASASRLAQQHSAPGESVPYGSGTFGSLGSGAPLDQSIYTTSYNLRCMYPDIYDMALASTKSDPVPNYTLISEWGDSLRAGANEAAKLYTRTTYNTTNAEVHKGPLQFDTIKEREFFKWMQRQKTYYGDLLSKAKRQDLESILEVATDAQKREILDALRQVHAAVDPDQVRSHSQTVHCDMAPTEDAALKQQLKELTKVRTMGGTHVVLKKPGQGGDGARQRPQTARSAVELRPSTLDLAFGGEGAGAAAGAKGGRPGGVAGVQQQQQQRQQRPQTAGATVGRRSGSVQPARAYVTAGSEKDTFRSKVPLQWAAGGGAANHSAYQEHYGGSKMGVGHQRPSSALFKNQAIKYREVTVPFGAVNPHTAMAPLRAAYPVPESFLGSNGLGATFPQRMADTTHRTDYAPRAEADVARTLRATAELTAGAHKALLRSTVPLGKNAAGLVMPKDWVSEMKDEYVEFPSSMKDNLERAAALRVMFNGPTASVGKVATLREHAGRP